MGRVGMRLLTPDIIATMPNLHATEGVPLGQKLVRAKLFTPWSSWTWYLIECEPGGPIAWGLVVGHESEFGYIDLAELEAVSGPGGFKVERDVHFEPCTVADVVRHERLHPSL